MNDRENAPQQKPKLRAPLGIPSGSIRALLTILVTGFIVLQTAEDKKIGLLWSETLMIMLAHYFTSRRFVELPRDLREQLEAEGKLPHDAQPLYLPKHTIRGLIILAFVGLAWYLHREGRLFTSQALTILGTVGAYFLGILVKAVKSWFNRHGAHKPANWWDDLKAIITLCMVVATIAVELFQLGDKLPLTQEQLESTMLGFILFYFGSR
jgi:hypothetical protein